MKLTPVPRNDGCVGTDEFEMKLQAANDNRPGLHSRSMKKLKRVLQGSSTTPQAKERIGKILAKIEAHHVRSKELVPPTALAAGGGVEPPAVLSAVEGAKPAELMEWPQFGHAIE